MLENSYTDDHPSTFNRDIPITCVNIDDDKSDDICASLRMIFEEVGRTLNIKSLKGISIAIGDEGYRKAIDLIDSSRQVSNGEVIGCALTITNIIEGGLESYIVLKDVSIVPLLVEEAAKDGEQVAFMLQVIAHECGHIHGDDLFHEVMGDIPKREEYKSHYSAFVFDISIVGWSEFSACFFSAHIGQCSEQSFRDIVESKVESIVDDLESFKLMKLEPVDLLISVYKNIGNLIKFSSYYIGWMFNNQLKPEKTKLYESLKDSWFLSYFLELDSIYEDILSKLSSKQLEFDEILEIGHLSKRIAEHFGFTTTVDRNNRTGIFFNN
ncbi:hypothetical protein [uncultured Psychrobacter sp.]|uniref:hypothetical protein n=1 Tax=uncultured Psychrobacter sp. TaxID=259303 RepID=UPI002613E767|nr:hypothetical protein [uncultured Psychrobacter sp.]